MDPQDFVSKHLGGTKPSRLVLSLGCGGLVETRRRQLRLHRRWSHGRAMQAQPVRIGREIFRRLQELETLKAALSQLEAEERIAIAQANTRPDTAWDPSVWK